MPEDIYSSLDVQANQLDPYASLDLIAELRDVPKPKTWGEVIQHGFGNAGVEMVRGLAGITKLESEVGGGFREWAWEKTPLGRKPEYLRKLDEGLRKWSDEMLTGIETYYEENPEVAIQTDPNAGFFQTLKDYATNPKMLVQGVIESAPLLLEGALGTAIAGPAGSIAMMAQPAMGSTYAKARKDGTDPLPAYAQSLLTGYWEAAIEQWTFGKKLGLAKRAGEIMGSGWRKVLWEGAKAGFRGATEEGTQQFNKNFWNWVFTDRSQKWLDGVAQAAGAGGPLELAMSGVFAGTGYSANKVGKLVDKRTKLYRLAKLKAQIQGDVSLTDEQRAEINSVLDEVQVAVEGGAFEQRVPPTEDIAEKVYMKGFSAALTAIRNNADNMLVGAGNKKNQQIAMKQDLDRIIKHYESISDTVAQNEASLPELSQIQQLLPDYKVAVEAFISKPSPEGFGAIKEIGDSIAELGTAYGQNISTERAKGLGGRIGPLGSEITSYSSSYLRAAMMKLPDSDTDRNPWVRRAAETAPSNEERILMVQFSSGLLTEGKEDPAAKAYYDKLYALRKGYNRPADFWEIPRWMGEMANFAHNTDVYVVRDMDEAKRFLATAGYGTIAFSALDVNQHLIKDIAGTYGGKIAVGGYVAPDSFKDYANVTRYENMEDFAKDQGVAYRPGTNYGHFTGTRTIPRLCLSKGCLHKCAFCTVPKGVTELSQQAIDSQVESFRDLDAELVYLDDKTFGQAPNSQRLIEIYERLKAQNANFKGFIVQTTAAQMRKTSVKFLKDAGIKFVELGVESYNDSVLKSMHKPASEKLIDAAVAKLREAGVSFVPNIMIGLPGENAVTYRRTLDFLRENSDIISHINIYNLALYEGTELSDVLESQDAGDVNENQIAKSFHKDPQIVIDFANEAYKLGMELLDRKTPLDEGYEEQKKLEAGRITYEKLLEEAMNGDELAVWRIQSGFFEGGSREGEDPTRPASPESKVKIHYLAKKLGIKGDERRDLMERAVGKRSAKNMTKEEADFLIEFLSDEIRHRGLPLTTGEELAEHVQRTTGGKVIRGVAGLDKRGLSRMLDGVRKGISHYWQGLRRIERMFMAFDGMEVGPIYNSTWVPVSRAALLSSEKRAGRINTFINAVEELVGGKSEIAEFVTKERQVIAEATDTDPAIELSSSEKVAVYIYSRNENATTHMMRGNFGAYKNPAETLIKILQSLTPEETAIGDWIIEDMKNQYDRINEASKIALGREIGKEDNYFSLYLKDVGDEFQPDFLAALMDQHAKGLPLEIGETKERVKGAGQVIRLDAFANYIYHVNRVEQFIAMAPVAKTVGDILKDKKFRKAISDATHGHGPRILDAWLRHSILGHAVENSSFTGKLLLTLRTNAMVYLLAGKIPSVMRQMVSAFPGVAYHPSALANFATQIAKGVDPRYYRKLRDRAFSKSALMRVRSYDRIEQTIRSRTKAEQAMLRKQPWSSKALAMIRWSDRVTTVHVWNANYDAALESEAVQKQYNLDGSEESAIMFADMVVSRTQPMASVEHLPDFFRGGPIERLLTTFQNQPNQNFNFWIHDIYEARKHGKINNTALAYRVLTSYIIPAMVFGMIGRADLPKNWKDVLFDLAVYPLGSLFLVGRIFVNALEGISGGGSVEQQAFNEAQKALTAIVKLEPGKAVKPGLKTVGALTGVIPHQAIVSAEGVYDLYDGSTNDLRRIIWSEWSLEKYGFAEKKGRKKEKRKLRF